MKPLNQGLLNDLTHVINRHSVENGSDTPDYILAGFLYQIIEAWNAAVAAREQWYGRPIGIRDATDLDAPPRETA